MQQDQDFPLPSLHPSLKLFRSADSDGEPSWSLHNPVANTYFKIAWAEFECLARFSKVKTAQELIALVTSETTVSVDADDLKTLIIFLHENGLLALSGRDVPFVEKKQALWKKILHSYLYFTIPLFEPEAFLKRTLPYVRPLMSRPFLMLMGLLFIVGTLMTLQRTDEFLHSFAAFLSLEGIIRGLIVLIFIKIVHEFAHAYTSIKYGIPVPHMGVALIVMYPVLYTETTGGWQLSSRRARFHIAIAGVTAELCLAAIFLIVWNMMPAGGVGQSISFTVVAVSLLGSLLVNFNPLMRFDGYYMMSELVGIDNLQTRACDFARWNIRRILFGLKDDVPEYLPAEKQKFLTIFGITLLVYRFFLFTGIAILVYHVFFKPLGLIMFAIELGWFVVLPIWSELKIWWQRRRDILSQRRAKILIATLCAGVILFVLPWQRTVYMPGVLHAEHYSAIYPYAPSYIEDMKVKEGQRVEAGQELARLTSRSLDMDVKGATQNLERMRRLQRRIQTDPALLQQKYPAIDLEIAKAEQKLKALQEQQKKLVVIAPFSGQVRDLDPDIKAGRFVKRTDLLFRVIDPGVQTVTAYVAEDDLYRLQPGDKAAFIADGTPFHSVPLQVSSLATTDADMLSWPEVASLFKGPVPAEIDRRSGQLVPLSSIYPVGLEITQNKAENLPDIVQVGQVRVTGRVTSPIFKFIKGLAGLIVREIGLN